MNGAFELALVSVLHKLEPEQIRLDQLFDDGGIRERIDGRDLGPALRDLALALDVTDRADRFSATQTLAQSVQRIADQPGLNSAEVQAGFQDLSARLLEPFIGEAAVDRAERLVGIASQLAETSELTDDIEDGLRIVFGNSLTAVERVNSTAGFEGRAAGFVAMFLELLFNRPNCRLETGTVDVDGTRWDAVLVELQVCTGRPFARCRHAIDPQHWQECNRYFFSSVNVRVDYRDNDGWAGVIRETVGPRFGLKYVTDLSVRCFYQPKLAAVAFDLAPDRDPPDDGSVVVDHGFLSVTDEVSHRQIRVMKVYRIQSFELPQDWICRLWAAQMSMAAWWC